jgi:SulP family sulfate permease
MALLCGALMLLAAVIKLGAVADLLSRPVLVGYLTGAALILVSTQLGKLFGIGTREHSFFPLAAEIVSRLRETHLLTFAVGMALLGIMALLRRFAPRLPGALVLRHA